MAAVESFGIDVDGGSFGGRSVSSSFNLESERMMSTSTAALIAAGAAKEAEDLTKSRGGKLTLSQATIVLFCTAFGAGIAFVGWYPKLIGCIGYVGVLLIVGTTAFLVEKAMMVTACEANAATFSELCLGLPLWTKLLSECSQIVWGFTLVGLYTQFVYGFINKQILEDRFAYSGIDALPLYSCVGIAVYITTTPTNFSGKIASALTKINLTITWIVILLAIFKGCQTITTAPAKERTETVRLFDSSKLLDVTVLLAGSMFQVACVPQLNYEIMHEKRERASWIVPGAVCCLQALIFCIVGLLGYLALGESIGSDGDVFKAYAEKAHAERRTDPIVSGMQGGIAMLMYLSTPLVSLPAKAQLWAFISAFRGLGPSDFAEAPVLARHGINLAMNLVGTLVPMSLGPDGFMNLLTIVAGIAANWINLFLPSLVILHVNVRPAYRRGERWRRIAVIVSWTFLLATASLISSAYKIYGMIAPADATSPTTTTTTAMDV